MLVTDAKAVGRQWVMEEVSRLPGFHGAYFAGSASRLPDDAALPATSDLDINVVFTGSSTPRQQGKILYRDVLLDVTPLSAEQLESPTAMLSHYHLAGGLRAPGVILDPTGQLTALQAAVADGFAKREWVRRRCQHAERRVLDGLAALDGLAPFHDQVIGWLFPAGITTHLLLVAGLKNPTVRRRYVAVRELLEEYGYLAFYQTLLDLLGCAGVSRARAETHLAALTAVFETATGVITTPFSFASEITDIARTLAIDGSRELIERGCHREAMFWIAVTYSRCRKVLAIDAPAEMGQRCDEGYWDLLSDLGITSTADLRRRSERVRAHLPEIWKVAEAIMAANPGIEG